MGLFSKTKKLAGWMSIGFHKDGVSVVHVQRSPQGLPKVGFAAFLQGGDTAPSATLEKLAKDFHAAKYQCTTLLSLGEYQLLTVDAPAVPQEELKTAIRWRLKDMLDFHVDDATIDVLDIPMDKNASGRNKSMFAVAARNQVIEQRQNMCTEAKIPLSVVDIPEMAQRNISALLEQDGRGVAMLSVTADGSLLTISYAGELYLARRVDLSLEQVSHTDPEYRRSSYDRITLELQRSLDHFDRQFHFITVSKLVISPLAEGAVGLQEYLAANMYLPVESLNLDTILDLSEVPELRSPENQQRYFMTLGAALRHEEKSL